MTIRTPAHQRDAFSRLALVSHTSCHEDFHWEAVPSDRLQLSRDGRYIETELNQCTILYLQEKQKRGAPVIVLANRQLNVSVLALKEKYRQRGCLLRVKFSSCKPAEVDKDYHLLADVTAGRLIPKSNVEAYLKDKMETIWQCDSPFDPTWEEGQLLGESFTVKTGPSEGQEEHSLTAQSQTMEWQWWVKPPNQHVAVAHGLLTISFVEADFVEQLPVQSNNSRSLSFSFEWPCPEVLTGNNLLR